MTNREIKRLFLYSDKVHATWDMKERKKFEMLISNKATEGLLTSQFIDILFITFDMILKVSDLCKSEIKKVEQQ